MDTERKISRETAPKQHLFHILVAAAIISTTALVILAVLGGVYIRKLQSEIESKTHSQDTMYEEHYQYTNEIGKEVVDVDQENKVAKFIQRDEDGGVVSVTRMDYGKRILSIYSSEVQSCYVAVGLDEGMGSFNHTLDFLTRNKDKVLVRGSDNPMISYNQVDGIAVQDKTFLPSDMMEYCESIDLFWIEKRAFQGGRMRQKRQGVRITIRTTTTITIEGPGTVMVKCVGGKVVFTVLGPHPPPVTTTPAPRRPPPDLDPLPPCGSMARCDIP